MKNMNFLFAAMIVIGCSMFCACNNSMDDDPAGTPKKYDVHFQYEVSSELFNLLDINITFVDKDGNKTTEKMTEKKWEKTISSTSLPLKAGYKVVKTRNSTPLEGESFLIQEKYYNDCSYWVTTESGELEEKNVLHKQDYKSGTVKKSEVENSVNSRINYPIECAYEITKDDKGEITANEVSLEF